MPLEYQSIQTYYDDNHTVNETAAHFSVCVQTLFYHRSKGRIKFRDKNESLNIRGTRSGCFYMDRSERSALAKQRKFGGYREGAGRSKKFYVKDSFNNEVCLQSSYEKLCAEHLDDLQIKWYRPKFLRYGSRRYFPDFYLPDYDIYLDPKNDYLIEIDREKINQVQKENNVTVLMLSKKQLNKNFILECLNWK